MAVVVADHTHKMSGPLVYTWRLEQEVKQYVVHGLNVQVLQPATTSSNKLFIALYPTVTHLKDTQFSWCTETQDERSTLASSQCLSLQCEAVVDKM